jgi:hypothetical protein
MVDDWVEDLLHDGVPYGTGHDRTFPCDYDKENLAWSGNAILNSCTPALRLELETTVPVSARNGPNLLKEILLRLYRPSFSKVQVLKEQLRNLKLRDFPGENVTSFVQKANAIILEMKMNFMKPDEVPDLVSVALTGLLTASDIHFQGKV